VGSGERAVEMFELTQLNEHLRSKVDVGARIAGRDTYVSDMYSCASQVIEAFPMIGVIISEVAPSNDGNYGARDASRVRNCSGLFSFLCKLGKLGFVHHQNGFGKSA